MNRYFKRLTNMLDNYYQSQGRGSHERYIEDRVIKYLCKESDEFKKLMKERKLEKLSKEEFPYLVSTLENKHKLADCILKDRLLEKMEIVEANQNRGGAIYPDIDSLYAKLVMSAFGTVFFADLQNCLKDTNYISAKRMNEFVDVLLNTKDDVFRSLNLLPISYSQFKLFTPEYLKLFMEYDCDSSLKNVTLAELSNCNMIGKFDSLEVGEFARVLNFMIKPVSLSSRIHIIKELLEKDQCKIGVIDKIDRLPEFLIQYLGKSENVDKKISENQEKLLEDICKMDEEDQGYYQSIQNTSENQISNLLELLVNDQFLKFSMEKRTFILNQIAYLDQNNQEEDQIRYRMKALFLVGSDLAPGFLTKVDHSYHDKTFQFIQKEENVEVLDTKFLVLSRLRKQIKKKSLSVETYGAYLESLQKTISSMDSNTQIKYLDSHSRFFEKHSLEKFAKQVNETRHKEELIEAMSENRKYKNLKYSYKLVDFIDKYSKMDLYDSNVASKIIEQMSNCQTHEGRKKIYHTVNNSNFCQMGIDKQHEILDDALPGYPIMLESMDVLDMQVLIPDYSHAQDVLEDQSSITFHNKDTKLRIKLMRKDKSHKKD